MDGEKNLGIEKTEGTEGTTSNGAALTEPQRTRLDVAMDTIANISDEVAL